MASREQDTRLFERAAKKRLAAAQYLFDDEKKQFNLDAIECALKAVILKRTPKSEYAGTIGQLTGVGAKAHDFTYLKNVLKRRLRKGDVKDHAVFGKLTQRLKQVEEWSTDLRYQAGFVRSRETAGFLGASEEILNWCLRG